MQQVLDTIIRGVRTSLICILLASINAACGSSALPQPTNSLKATLPATTNSPTVSATFSASLIPTPTEPSADDALPNYNLNVELNYPLHQIAVEETITYTNRTKEPLKDIVLMVEPNRYDGTFHLKNFIVNEKNLSAAPDIQANQMHLALEQPLSPNQKLYLSISYELNLPRPIPNPTTRPVPFGWTERQTNLVDWYPFIPPYVEGEGWLAHQPGYFGEHLVYETSNFDVTIKNRGKETLHAPTTSSDNGETQPGQLTIAASAPARQNGNEIHYVLSKARTFAWSVSHDYLVQTQMVGNILVIGYAFPIHAQAAEAALRTTAQSLDLFQKLFAPYPHSTLSVVEADFLDGMEYDGLYFLSNGFYNLYQGNPAEYLVAIAAHETSHQWWFGIIGNDQAEQPWLDESLATYSEKLYYEYTYPEAQTWWWTYRVDFFKPDGFINGSIYSFSNSSSPYESYRNAVYLNGAKFLEDLRKAMGNPAFFNFLKRYVSTYQYKIVTTKDFFNLLKQSSTIDLDPLIKNYFNESP
ncbi:MAG: M1 family metallopeptidase [Anaerolineales bacterium]